jgi:hypothetical protein
MSSPPAKFLIGRGLVLHLTCDYGMAHEPQAREAMRGFELHLSVVILIVGAFEAGSAIIEPHSISSQPDEP